MVSNTAGATTNDRDGQMKARLETATGALVLSHRVMKPGCRDEIMAYFQEHPETGVTHPSQLAIIGDRLATDMMMANMMGSWGVWVKDGVKPLSQKNIVGSSLIFDLHAYFANSTPFVPSSRELSNGSALSSWLVASKLLSLKVHSNEVTNEFITCFICRTLALS